MLDYSEIINFGELKVSPVRWLAKPLFPLGKGRIQEFNNMCLWWLIILHLVD